MDGMRVEELSDLMLSEADLLIVPHINFEVKHHQMKSAVVESNDSDIVCLTLFSFETLMNNVLENLWVSLGTGNFKRWIPIHELFSSLVPVKQFLRY